MSSIVPISPIIAVAPSMIIRRCVVFISSIVFICLRVPPFIGSFNWGEGLGVWRHLESNQKYII